MPASVPRFQIPETVSSEPWEAQEGRGGPPEPVPCSRCGVAPVPFLRTPGGSWGLPAYGPTCGPCRHRAALTAAGLPATLQDWTTADPITLPTMPGEAPLAWAERFVAHVEQTNAEAVASGQLCRLGLLRQVRDLWHLLRPLVETGRGAAVGAPWALAHGPVGSGKSRVMAAALSDLVRDGARAIWVTEADMLEGLKAEFDSSGPRPYRKTLESIPLLVIDELGTRGVRASDWARGVIEHLISARELASLPTWITSNLPLTGDDLSLAEVYGDRFVSRIVGRARAGGGLFEVRGWEWRAGRPHA